MQWERMLKESEIFKDNPLLFIGGSSIGIENNDNMFAVHKHGVKMFSVRQFTQPYTLQLLLTEVHLATSMEIV